MWRDRRLHGQPRRDPGDRIAGALLLSGAVALAAGGGMGAASESAGDAETLRLALAAAIERPGSWSDLHLLAECRSGAGTRTLEVFGTGVGIWNGVSQFRLAGVETAQLLRMLQRSDFPAFESRYGGKGLSDPGAPPEAAGRDSAILIVCQVDLTLDGLSKRSAQLDKGRQSEELRALAAELLDFCQTKGEAGGRAVDLEDGLHKIVRGELSPEVLSLQLQWRPSPHEPSAAARGFLLSLRGSNVETRSWSGDEGFAKPVELTLGAGEISDLVEVLAHAGLGGLPRNLWAREYTDLSVRLLGHRTSIQARQFSGLTPETHGDRQRAFDGLCARLQALHRRVLSEGRPNDSPG